MLKIGQEVRLIRTLYLRDQGGREYVGKRGVCGVIQQMRGVVTVNGFAMLYDVKFEDGRDGESVNGKFLEVVIDDCTRS